MHDLIQSINQRSETQRRQNLFIEFRDIFVGATALSFQLPVKL